MIKTSAIIILLTLVLTAGALASELAVTVSKNLTSMPLAFTENHGQWDDKVLFRADAGGATMWFATDGAYYQFTRRMDSDGERDGLIDPGHRPVDREPDKYETMMIKANFVGSNPAPRMVGEDILEYKCNYFIGNDPSQWRTDVANYSAVVYEEIYPDIDLKYYGNGKQMEYDFIVSPGAEPSQIRIQYEGVESLSVNGDGELIVETMWGEVIERRPVVYQVQNGERVSLDGRYLLNGDNSFGFSLASDYDPSLPLVIDPVLSYSTYLGGSSYDQGYAIAVDGSEAAYVTGTTYSTTFPTLNPYQTYQGGRDVFVTKLSAEGNSLVYSTYLGGSDSDYGNGIAVDASGAAYVTGYTESTNFPTLNPYQSDQASDDVFVTKLSADGNCLVYSTYLGGSGWDFGAAVAVDLAGAAYVTGVTSSTDFPTLNPYQTYQGSRDVFVTKLSGDGNSLAYSTYLGGSGWDFGAAVAVDLAGAAYVTGVTSSTDFPTLNPYQSDQASDDVFVTKLSSSGNVPVYSTYLGGSGDDRGWGIAVDASGAAYVTGYTYSSDFPTLGPFQTDEYYYDVFVTKLSSDGNSLLYSTYLGGDHEDVGYAIAVDVSGAAYVTGYTTSTDFPTLYPFQTDQYNFDVFVTKLSSSGNSLVYSTYLGGNGDEYGRGICVDASGAAYATGGTYSTDFPTESAYQETLHGSGDVFVTKLVESCCLLRGDINHDGGIDPLDAAYFVNYLWLVGPEPPCMDEADVSGSGSVDPLDAVYLVNYFWKGGPAPVPCP